MNSARNDVYLFVLVQLLGCETYSGHRRHGDILKMHPLLFVGDLHLIVNRLDDAQRKYDPMASFIQTN